MRRARLAAEIAADITERLAYLAVYRTGLLVGRLDYWACELRREWHRSGRA